MGHFGTIFTEHLTPGHLYQRCLVWNTRTQLSGESAYCFISLFLYSHLKWEYWNRYLLNEEQDECGCSVHLCCSPKFRNRFGFESLFQKLHPAPSGSQKVSKNWIFFMSSELDYQLLPNKDTTVCAQTLSDLSKLRRKVRS